MWSAGLGLFSLNFLRSLISVSLLSLITILEIEGECSKFNVDFSFSYITGLKLKSNSINCGTYTFDLYLLTDSYWKRSAVVNNLSSLGDLSSGFDPNSKFDIVVWYFSQTSFCELDKLRFRFYSFFEEVTSSFTFYLEFWD